MNPAEIAPEQVGSEFSEFVDRRQPGSQGSSQATERRQFGNSYEALSAEARELAERIDEYKLRHHRRFITYEELHGVIQSLGYHK